MLIKEEAWPTGIFLESFLVTPEEHFNNSIFITHTGLACAASRGSGTYWQALEVGGNRSRQCV